MNENLTIHQKNYRRLAQKANNDKLEASFLFHIRAYGLPDMIRNYRFDEPDSRMEFDFCHLPSKVAVEIQGGIYGPERTGHSTGRGISRDIRKVNTAQIKGWLLLLLTPDMALDGTGALLVKRAITMRAERVS